MDFLTFNFGHPVKGHALLLQLLTTEPARQHMTIDSESGNDIEVPITACRKGKWSIILDWEYDGRTFIHHEEFEI